MLTHFDSTADESKPLELFLFHRYCIYIIYYVSERLCKSLYENKIICVAYVFGTLRIARCLTKTAISIPLPIRPARKMIPNIMGTMYVSGRYWYPLYDTSSVLIGVVVSVPFVSFISIDMGYVIMLTESLPNSANDCVIADRNSPHSTVVERHINWLWFVAIESALCV